MFLMLPETSGANILLRRAQRLRKLTGDDRFMSQSEIDQRNMKVSAVALDALIKPIEITFKDPAVLFVQIYTAIIYGIYYSCKFFLPSKVKWFIANSSQSSRSSLLSTPSTTA